jgi:hypothetical protein
MSWSSVLSLPENRPYTIENTSGIRSDRDELVSNHQQGPEGSPHSSESMVASSAPASEIGMRKRMVPIMYHPMQDQANSH